MLKVNEIFGPTIQGEGKTSGKKVIFIRLALCNLKCSWCDTPYTWNWKASNQNNSKYIPCATLPTFSKEDEIHSMTDEEVIKRVQEEDIDRVNAIVLSGGEPLLQQKQLISTLVKLKQLGYWIEVETNGTIVPLQGFLDVVDQINCSPKLSNSNNSSKLRERPIALQTLSQNIKTNFKFVVSSEQDIEEILYLVKTYHMNDVYLMPLGVNRTELEKSRQLTQSLARQYGFNYTDRLHIVLLGGKRGV